MGVPIEPIAVADDTERPTRDESRGDTVARLDDASHSFADLTVIDSLTLTLSAETVTALVGPNGSGKTTLLRLFAGVLPLDSGERTISASTERPVGYLPQAPQFRGHLTVQQTLQFYADLLERDVEVEDAIAQVGLDDVRDRRVDALSGGMRRLLGLAQAFLGDPALLVLDEPMSGLDPRMQRHVQEVIAGVSAAGPAVLVATHDLTWANRADEVAVIDRGRILVERPPAELIADTGTGSLVDAVLDMLGEEPTVQAGRGR